LGRGGRAGVVVVQLGQTCQNCCEGFRARLQELADRQLVALELFLKERGQDHRRRAGFFHAAEHVEIAS
jgi:hypothetical protein